MLIRERPPPRTAVGVYAWCYCRVLRGGEVLRGEVPMYPRGVTADLFAGPCVD